MVQQMYITFQFAVFALFVPVIISAFCQECIPVQNILLNGRLSSRTVRIRNNLDLHALKRETGTNLFYRYGDSSNGARNESQGNMFMALDILNTRTIANPEYPKVDKDLRKQESDDINTSKPIKFSRNTAVAFGMLLAMTSGFVNGACLSGFWSLTHSAAAVTGTWTSLAIAMASGQSGQFVTTSKYLLSFMIGSGIAGYFNPNPVPFEINNPKGVAIGFGVGTMALTLAGLFGNAAGLAGQGFLCLCLMANGIQNSLTSSLTANLCRTSHLSGITSDIGTFVGQILRGNRANVEKLQTFVLLAASFWTGACISHPLSRVFDSRILLLPAAMYATIASKLGFYAQKNVKAST